MLIKQKMIFFNYLIMIFLFFIITMFQNSFWPSLFGIHLPVYLWIPYLIYWSLYRKPGEAALIVYFITISIAATSSLMVGYLLVCNSLIFLSLLLFKRVYYTSWVFFSTACALTVFFFPILLWTIPQIIGGKTYFHGFIPWLAGGLVTWILSFPLLVVFQWIDNLTIVKSTERRQPAEVL